MSDQRNEAAFNAVVGDARLSSLTVQDVREIVGDAAGATRQFLAERTKEAIETTREWTERPERSPAVQDVVYRLWQASRAADDDFLLMDIIQVLIYARDLQ